jgi:alkylation response protein AidB-like acyl-CoA dehydrogenase
MSMTTISDTKPDTIDAALKKYGPILNSEANASAENSGLTPTAVQAFLDGGFAHLDLPKEYGGYGEYRYSESARVVEELSRYDSGAGWVLHAAGGFTGLFAAMLPEKGFQALWGDDARSIIVGMAAPRGKAVRTDNGYTVEGKFQFASGANVATHFTGGCAVYENGKPVLLDDGSPKFIGIVVTRDQIKELGNWDVIGLKATSSIDYEIEPTFVSDDFLFNLNPWPAAVLRGAPRHRVGLGVHGVTGQPPVSLGAARRALEEIAALARTRKRRDGPYPTVADQPLFQHEISLLDAELTAARLAYYAFVEDVDDYATNQTTPMGPEWGNRASQVSRYALDVALKCVDFAYYWSGTSGLRHGNIIGRLFMDVHAMNLHLVMDRNTLIKAAPTVIEDLVSDLGRY